MRVPKRKSEQNKLLKKQTPFYITKEGLELYKQELAELEAKLPEMIELVEHTKSHGDFSENAAYQDAKHTLRRANRKILIMKDRINKAILIEKKKTDTVQLGSTVIVETNGKEFSFEILGSHESNPAKGIISQTSPLGKLLLGKKVGDNVELTLEERVIQYVIKSIV